jgi:nucleotide-binding universal stress UspA family protein
VFRRILVAVDGSAHSDRALREAIDLAQTSEAHLTVMTSVPDVSSIVLGGASVTSFDVGPIMEENERQYELVLQRAVDAVPKEVPSNQVLAHGVPAQTIIDQVHSGEHDLLVMGSRGRGELKSLLLGSVSHLLNTSQVAVLIVHASPNGD